jgi:hypothetical protein
MDRLSANQAVAPTGPGRVRGFREVFEFFTDGRASARLVDAMERKSTARANGLVADERRGPTFRNLHGADSAFGPLIRGRRMNKRTYTTVLLGMAAAIGLSAPDHATSAENIAAKKLVLKDPVDPAKRGIVVSSKDAGIAYSEADSPGTNGAILRVYSATDDYCLRLPGGPEWSDNGKVWKYKNKAAKNLLSIKDGKLLVRVKSGVTYSLRDDGSQGAVNVQVQFGTAGARYCMRCDAAVKDSEKVFTARDCVATACDIQASSCFASKVFVSSQTYNGNLGGLAGADEKCQDLADAAGLDGAYAAWLSDGSTNAASRLTPSGIPYELVNETLVANNFADLIDGSLVAPINRDENGVLLSARAWTGTAPTGTACYRGNNGVCTSTVPGMDSGVTRSLCSNWTTAVPQDQSVTGVAQVDGRWTLEGDRACTDQERLYCIEQ